MLRLAYGDQLEDRCALELVGISLVGRRSRGIQSQCIVDLRLIVVWIALSQLLHGFRIGLNAGAMVDFLVVGIHDPERVQIVTLALSLRADALSFRYHRSAVGEILDGRRGVGIPQQAER